MTCTHPISLRRVERVRMPEAVYRTERCKRCATEFPAEVIPSRLTRAVMAAIGASDPDDFGISYRDKRGFSPIGLAARIGERIR